MSDDGATITFTYEELLRLSDVLQRTRRDGVIVRKVERALRRVEDAATGSRPSGATDTKDED